MKKSILVLFTCLWAPLFAQTTFQLTLDFAPTENIEDIAETAQHDYVAVSSTYNGSNYDIILVKFSSSGVILATNTISTASSEIPKSICSLSDGGFFITGYTFNTPSDNDALVLKVDSSLNLSFYKRYGVVGGNDYANEGFEIIPGEYSFSGTIAIGGSAKPSFVTLDNNGVVIRQHYLNTNQFASPDYHGTYLGNGNMGYAHLSNIISILDTAFNTVHNFSSSIGGYTTRVNSTNDNKCVAVGVAGFGGPSSGLALMKSDPTTGTTSILKKYSLAGNDLNPNGVFQDNNGNYYISGNKINFNNGTSEAFVIKTDSTGLIIWAKTYKPTTASESYCSFLLPTSDGGFMIGGYSGSFSSNDLFVAKLDTSGVSSCNSNIITLSTSVLSLGSAIAHTATGGSISIIAISPPTVAAASGTTSIICLTSGNYEIPESSLARIYPSIFTDALHFTSETGNWKITIYDMQGKDVFNKKVTNAETLHLQNLNSGLYIYVAHELSNGSSVTGKIFKE